MNPSMVEFVREAMLRGVARQDIAEALLKGGWSAREIQDALDAFVSVGLPLPVPCKRVSTSPREAFYLLLLFSALYTAALGLGSMLFDLVNLWLMQPGERIGQILSSLRVGMASVVVAFPVFLMMSRLISRETALNPGQKISPIRRWLTYFTLFVTSIAMISDLITLLVTFLNGDLTLGFVLKTAVVAVLAGGIFVYYFYDLRRDEVAPQQAGSRPRPGARVLLAGLVSFIVTIIAVGYLLVGSPLQARLLSQDQERVHDLAAMVREVEQYYQNTGTLPASLDQCDTNPATYIRHKNDRITNKPYVYQITGDRHFEVGATFALPSPQNEKADFKSGSASPKEAGFWKHTAGPQVFRIEVKPRETTRAK